MADGSTPMTGSAADSCSNVQVNSSRCVAETATDRDVTSLALNLSVAETTLKVAARSAGKRKG